MTHTAAVIPGFEGPQIAPDHPEYPQACRVWNGAVVRRPVVVARCLHVADVRTAVGYARARQLPFAVRGGGHSPAGHGVCDGVVIDLGLMNRVVVDVRARRATVGPGVRWGRLDEATRPHGLATPGGDQSTVGVTGLTLGGGLGWLSRMYGMACDNVVAAQIVTAEGDCLEVDEASHPDLFWAIRGGGGNFGVITRLEFALHVVPPTMLAGVLYFPAAAALDVLARIEELTPALPDEVSWSAAFLSSSDDHSPATTLRELPTMELRLCYVGEPDERASQALSPLRAIAKPVLDTVRPIAYVDLQKQADSNAPFGAFYATRSEWLGALGTGCIRALSAAAADTTCPQSLTLIHPLGGAISRRSTDATAFGWRHASYLATIVAAWLSPADDGAPYRSWADRLWQSLQDVSLGGGYLNILGDEPHERVRSSYGPQAYARLETIKNRYDPGNLFTGNPNVRPTVRRG